MQNQHPTQPQKIENEPDSGFFRALLGYYQHQDNLLWNRLQTIGVIQIAGLGAAYGLKSNRLVSMLLILFGLMLSILIFLLMKRDEMIRDSNLALVDKIVNQLAKPYNENFRMTVKPKWPAPFRGKTVLLIMMLLLLSANILTAIIILFN